MQPVLRNSGATASEMTRRDLFALAALGLVASGPGSAIAAGPDGQLTWGVHVSLAPVWFDPADVSGIITPFMVLYALHDAMVKLLPGQSSPAPSLAEAWSASEDGLTYDFTLRQGTLFHNGDPVTAEDVKFSFERYHGTAHDLMMAWRRYKPRSLGTCVSNSSDRGPIS
jgi:peptide/nickel transport system substrate-binding protein